MYERPGNKGWEAIITVCTGAIGWWWKEMGERCKHTFCGCVGEGKGSSTVLSGMRNWVRGRLRDFSGDTSYSPGPERGNLVAPTFSTYFAASVFLGCPWDACTVKLLPDDFWSWCWQ